MLVPAFLTGLLLNVFKHKTTVIVLRPGDEEDSDKEEDEELDKKMGDLGDGPTDTLDERMWGDDDDDDDDMESSDKEEESGPGMDQVMARVCESQKQAS